MTLEGALDLIAELRERIDAMAAQFVVFTKVAKTGADGSREEAQMSEDDKDNQRPYLRTTPWGIAGRPVVGVAVALARAFGGSFGGVQIGIYTKDHGPQNLEEGETSLYCKADGTRVWLDKNGKIHIDAASGQDVVFNGGSLKVARKTDKTIADMNMATWIAAAQVVLVDAAAIVGKPAPVAPTDFGVINDGAPHVLG